MAVNRHLSHHPIEIAAGRVKLTSHVNKFGYTGTDLNGTATIWDGNGTTANYPYPAAGTAAATSTQNSGAKVEIQGLDDNYELATEIVTIGGGAGSTTFSRIFRAKMINATNGADVTINQGGNLAAKILANNSQTLMTVYTIPKNTTGYLLKFQGSADKDTDVKFRLMAREPKRVFNIKGQWGTRAGNAANYDYPVPLVFPELTDIKVEATTGASCGCGAIFDLILVNDF